MLGYLIIFVLISLLSTSNAIADTNVSGIITTNTVWTKNNSPYIITDTVQIPWGVTLTVEPGVVVTKPTSGDMFLLNGTIYAHYAHGVKEDKITFNGGDNSDFFHITGSISESAFLDLEYCIIKNGLMFWPGAIIMDISIYNILNLLIYTNNHACGFLPEMLILIIINL